MKNKSIDPKFPKNHQVIGICDSLSNSAIKIDQSNLENHKKAKEIYKVDV